MTALTEQDRPAGIAMAVTLEGDEPPEDELEASSDGPYCMCDLQPTIEESDSGSCDCCGKTIY